MLGLSKMTKFTAFLEDESGGVGDGIRSAPGHHRRGHYVPRQRDQRGAAQSRRRHQRPGLRRKVSRGLRNEDPLMRSRPTTANPRIIGLSLEGRSPTALLAMSRIVEEGFVVFETASSAAARHEGEDVGRC